MSQLRVFLSHSSQDKAFADVLVRAFRQAGADVWYDEESLGAGHLRRTIMKELAERPVFVVLLPKVALAPQWVLDECEWAYDLQQDDLTRIMLPVVVAQVDRTDLNVALYLCCHLHAEAFLFGHESILVAVNLAVKTAKGAGSVELAPSRTRLRSEILW